LILHDEGLAVDAENIKALTSAAGVKVAAFWPTLFSRVLGDKNMDDLILNAGSSGFVAAGPGPATGGSGGDGGEEKVEEEKKEEKKEEEEEEESDEDMGFGLFD